MATAPAAPLKLHLFQPGWGLTMLPPEDHPDYELLDAARLPEAHAVIFHIPTAGDLRGVRKSKGQKWVAWSLESDINYPMLRYPPFLERFDLTMTYRLDSDVPMVYFNPWVRDRLLNPPRAKTAAAPAAWFASNARDRCGRAEYVTELMRFLPVDSYGKCLRNQALPEDRGRESKLATLERYRFDLAFENSLSHDYVTEKFFDPLIAGCVPVYRGAPNVADFAPGENCYIDARNFSGPQELVRYLLWLTENPTEYEKYLAWKQQPLRQAFVDKVALTAAPPLARLCAKLRALGCGRVPARGLWSRLFR